MPGGESGAGRAGGGEWRSAGAARSPTRYPLIAARQGYRATLGRTEVPQSGSCGDMACRSRLMVGWWRGGVGDGTGGWGSGGIGLGEMGGEEIERT